MALEEDSDKEPDEPPHEKTNKLAGAPSEDSDTLSDQSLRCPHEESLGP